MLEIAFWQNPQPPERIVSKNVGINGKYENMKWNCINFILIKTPPSRWPPPFENKNKSY